MKLETRRFGAIEVNEDGALDIPSGIPGFPDMHRVVLMNAAAMPGAQPDASDPTLFWLQDLDDGDLSFLCVVPWASFPEYDFEIDAEGLGIDDDADVRILCLITVRNDDGGTQLSANLRAPLIVDLRHQRLHQVILGDTRWPVSASLAATSPAEVH